VGGTAYSGQLVKPVKLESSREEGEVQPGLRELLGEERQRQLLKAEAKEVAGSDGRQFEGRHQDPDGKVTPWRTVSLANKVEGDTPEARAKAFTERAGHLPDLSIEQIFPSSQAKEPDYKEGYSRFFNARTTEREPELVQATLDRLLREKTDG